MDDLSLYEVGEDLRRASDNALPNPRTQLLCIPWTHTKAA